MSPSQVLASVKLWLRTATSQSTSRRAGTSGGCICAALDVYSKGLASNERAPTQTAGARERSSQAWRPVLRARVDRV